MDWFTDKKELPYKIVDLVQGTDEWKKYRSTRIGASDIPSICEVNGRYKSFNDVLFEKVNGEEKVISSFQQNIFKKGHESEAKIRAEHFLGFKPVVIESFLDSNLFCSLDGMNDKGEIIEIKWTSSASMVKALRGGRVPEVWNYQIQYQMMISGQEFATLAVMLENEDETVIKKIYKDRNVVDLIYVGIEKFKKALENVYFASSSFDEQLTRIADLKLEIESLKKEMDAKDLELHDLCAFVLDTTKLDHVQAQSVKVARLSRKGSVDYAKIPELNGVDLEKYRKESTSYIKVTLQK